MNGGRLRGFLKALTGFLVLNLVGCFGAPSSFMKQQKNSQLTSATIKASYESGVTSGDFDPTLAAAQSLKVAEGDLAGSEARFPAGALGISTQISIQEGVPIATPALAGSLSVTSGFKSTATPVAVTSSEKVDAVNPFTIAIPLPQTSLWLFGDAFENLVVTYVIQVAASGETRVGMIPRSALKIENNRVVFDTYYFGVYQAAFTAEKITEERKATTTTFTVATKSVTQELPKLSITSRSPFVAKAGEMVTLRGKNIRPTIRLALAGTQLPSLNLMADAVSFTVPAETSVGLLKLTAEQDGTTQDVSLVYGGSGSYPVISEDKSKICSDVQFYDLNGQLQTGTRSCGSGSTPTLANCNQNGQIDCKANSAFIAVDASQLAAGNIRKGANIGGVAGDYPSVSYPLATGGASDLTQSMFELQVRNAAAFKWFDSKGDVHTKNGDPDIASENIKSNVEIFGITGSGTLESHSSCATDGEVGCIVVGPAFKAADMSQAVAANIKSGATIAGVPGNVTPSPSACASDGSGSCVVDGTNYKAAKLSNFVAGDVKTGVTIAGVAGSASVESHSNCSVDGAASCVVDGSTYKAAKLSNFVAGDVKTGVTIAGVAGSLGNCANGGSGCFVQGPTFKAVTSADLSTGNIKDGATIGGVAGTYGPACASDGAGSCLVDGANYKAAKLSNFIAGDVKTGITIAGVGGSATLESHSNCAADGAMNCVATASYKAADMSFVMAGNIKAGTAIAGVVGQYPSASYPLTSNTATADLDFATFNAKIKSPASFEWFDSSGVRYTNTGDSNITANNISNGITIFGETGTLTGGAFCTGDGQENCFTTPPYKSVDTTAYTDWDIRKGKTVGGKSGKIVFYKSMAGSYDNTTAPAGPGVDVWDTIDDFNNGGAFPTTAPGAWDVAAGANWIMDSASDNGGGGGTAANQLCDGGEACIFKDQLTGLMWAKHDGVGRTWQAAIEYCDGLSYGSYTDWRLPTGKELVQAHINGIWSLYATNKLNLSEGNGHWSSTSNSSTTTYAWYVKMGNGSMITIQKSDTNNRVLCVRP